MQDRVGGAPQEGAQAVGIRAAVEQVLDLQPPVVEVGSPLPPDHALEELAPFPYQDVPQAPLHEELEQPVLRLVAGDEEGPRPLDEPVLDELPGHPVQHRPEGRALRGGEAEAPGDLDLEDQDEAFADRRTTGRRPRDQDFQRFGGEGLAQGPLPLLALQERGKGLELEHGRQPARGGRGIPLDGVVVAEPIALREQAFARGPKLLLRQLDVPGEVGQE